MSALHLKWWRQLNQRQMARDFLSLPALQGKEIEAYKACQECNRRWGIVIDWHLFSDALEEMVRKGQASIVRPGHITVYVLGVNYRD